jgi:hypothetical protein
MRVLLRGRVAWMLPLPIEAKRDHRERDKRPVLIVEDHTGAAWKGVVAQTVADFNGVIPKRGPRLRYVRGKGSCGWEPRSIVICHDEIALPQFGGTTRHLVRLDPDYPERANAVCHELMHALTGIADNYDARVDSCVWGRLDAPGPFDVAHLREAFGRHR